MKQQVTRIFSTGIHQIININKPCFVKNVYVSVNFVSSSTRNSIDIGLNYVKAQTELNRMTLNMGLLTDHEILSNTVDDLIRTIKASENGFYLQGTDSLAIDVLEKNETDKSFRSTEDAFLSVIVNYIEA